MAEATGPAVADDMTALTRSSLREFSNAFCTVVPQTTHLCFERMGLECGCLFACSLVLLTLVRLLSPLVISHILRYV